MINLRARNCPRPLFLGILLAGCAAEPFARPILPVLVHPDPQTVVTNFAQSIPDTFTSDDTLILQFPFHTELVMLGVLNINRSANTFELYALNQTGLTYFHLSGDRHTLTIQQAIGPWLEHKDILFAIAQDIENIYFDPTPDPTSDAVDLQPTQLLFSRRTTQGKLIHQFGSLPTVLIQKQMDGCFGATWRARYYDYQSGSAGKLFPHGITMDNDRFHYRLIIKNRDWSIDGKQ